MAGARDDVLERVLGELKSLLDAEREALRELDSEAIDDLTAKKVALEAQLGALLSPSEKREFSPEALSRLEAVRAAAHENHLLIVHARSCVRAGIAAATGVPSEDYPAGRPGGSTTVAAVKVDIRG